MISGGGGAHCLVSALSEIFRFHVCSVREFLNNGVDVVAQV